MLPNAFAHYPGHYDESLLAITIIELHTLTIVYSSPAFLRFVKSHSLISGQEFFREPALRAAAQTCWQHQVMAVATLPQSRLRFELSPLPLQEGAGRYVQCLLLDPQQQAPASEQALRQLNDPALAAVPMAYARILDSLPHNTWLCTPLGEVFWSNRTSNRFTYGKDEVHDASNTRYISKVHPDDLTGAGVALSLAMQGTPPARPCRYRLRDHRGVYRWHEFSVSPVHDDDGHTLYWVGTSVDIEHTVADENAFQAHQATATAQLASLREELDRHVQHTAVEQKMALVNHLAGGIAHDLNNLLQVVVACTEMALLAAPEPVVASKLHLIADCVNRAGRMSSQLASFSGRMQQNAQVLDTNAALQDCVQLLQRAVGAEIAFESRIAENLHPVMADRSQLENTLINLAINARDAVNGRGRVLFDASNTCTTDAMGNVMEQVQMTLSDDGVGMDQALQRKIFEPFFTTKADGKGTGLGLPMVRRFVDASNGQLTLQSAPGKGTSISLILPRSSQQAVPLEAPLSTRRPLKLKVLLIEDDEQVRQAIHLLLVQLECEVIPSFNIDHALALLDRGLRPDAIVSDIRMPGRNNAINLIQWVQANGDIALFFATGYSPDVAVEEGLIDGKYPVLFKPFSLQELSSMLQENLRAEKKPR